MLFMLVLIVATAHTQAWKLWQVQPTICRVHGSIKDTRMVGVGVAQVEFTSGGKRFTEHTAADGTYSLSLPSGSYALRVTADGFCGHTMEAVIAKAESEKTLDIALLDCSDCTKVIIDFVEPRIEPDVVAPKPPNPQSMVFKYQQERLEDGKSAGIKPSVLFGRRSDAQEFIEYAGLDCPGNEKLAILEYNGGALKAKKIRYTREAHKIRGEGEVTVVDRRGVSRGSIVEVDLGSESPTAVILK